MQFNVNVEARRDPFLSKVGPNAGHYMIEQREQQNKQK